MVWGDVALRVAPETLRRQAFEVDRRIDALNARFQELDGIMKRSRSYWVGASGTLYRDDYDREREQIRQMLTRLRRFPRELLEISGNYVKTDETLAASAALLKTDALR